MSNRTLKWALIAGAVILATWLMISAAKNITATAVDTLNTESSTIEAAQKQIAGEK